MSINVACFQWENCLSFSVCAEVEAAAMSAQKKKASLVRRRSSDGFSVLLHCQSRLQQLYNETLGSQVQLCTGAVFY